jgi:hypothetical protein
MIHLIKKNKWECLLYSFAMAMEISPSELVRLLGHDGGGIISGGERRGFHVQEFIQVAITEQSQTITPVEFCPVSKYTSGMTLISVDMAIWSRFVLDQIKAHRGVITGLGLKSKGGHAVAFDKGTIYDPDGGEPFEFTFNISHSHEFVPQTAWIVQWKT